MKNPEKCKSPQVDLRQAEQFLRLIEAEAESWLFRAIRKKDGRTGEYRGSLELCAPMLQAANDEGFCIFVVVNEASGFADDDVTRVRAVFGDFDAAKGHRLPESFGGLDPHVIVNTSLESYHSYWLVDGLSVDQFKATQQAIAAKFGSDAAICNPARLMRLPGFLHRKAEPFQTCIIHESGGLPFDAERLLAAFPARARQKLRSKPGPAGDRVVAHDRHDDILKLTGRFAREIVYNGMSRDAALRALYAEQERGRWTRQIDPGEFERALDGAVAKHRDGEWNPPSMPATPASTDPAPLHVVELGDLSAATVESPRFVVAPIIPRRVVTMLSAPGGTGKTTLALAIQAHVADGRPFGPFEVERGRTLFVSLEDESDQIRFQIRNIVKSFRLDAAAVAAKLHILDGAADDVSLARESKEYGARELVADPALAQLERVAAGVALIVIDGVGDALRGDTNDAPLVRDFIRRKLGGIARRCNCAIVLIGHVDKAGSRHGTQGQTYLGSVEFNNSPRSRLALTERDGDLWLDHEKANRSAKAAPLRLRRDANGVLMPAGDGAAAQLSTELADAETVLVAMRAAQNIGVNVPPGRVGSVTALSALSTLAELPSYLKGARGKDRFWRGLDRLLRDGKAERVEFRTPDRKTRERIVPKVACAE